MAEWNKAPGNAVMSLQMLYAFKLLFGMAVRTVGTGAVC